MTTTPPRRAPADATPSASPRATTVRTLRVSLTARCNLRCRYCVPAAGPKPVPTPRPATPALVDSALWLVDRLAIKRIRLTGGEPLLAPGLLETVGRFSAHPGIHEVAMTTNGVRLARTAERLRAAGLSRVNVSIDTLDPSRFAALTGAGVLARVIRGIDAAVAAGLAPVKLNAVLRRSSWRRDVPALLDFAAGRGLEIRFIELMRTGPDPAWCAAEQVSAETVRVWLTGVATVLELAVAPGRPARPTAVRWRGATVRVGWITPVSHAFCAGCDRLRLDAAGTLRRCLMDPEALPLHQLLARDGERHTLRAVVDYLAGKRAPAEMRAPQAMLAIGG